ncbi:MAG: hypothetical protein LBT89_06400 [Planctomycetaceae bacterium]|jgi:hypothetical protein|nr:hypothetical protein [Planctomycetaceae bacterium]
MEYDKTRKGFYGALPGLILAAFFSVGVVFADGLSDFEKMLQDAIQDNASAEQKTAARTASNTPALVSKKKADAAPLPEAAGKEPKVLEAKKVAATAVKDKKTAEKKPEAAALKAAEIIDGGWATVEPNDPNTVVPDNEKEEVAEEKKETAVEETEEEAETETETKAEVKEVPAEEPETEEPEAADSVSPETKVAEKIVEKVTEKAVEKATDKVAEGTAKPARPEKPAVIAAPAKKEEAETEKPEKSEKPDAAAKADNAAPAKIAERKTPVSVPDFDVDDEKKYTVLDASLVGDSNGKNKVKLMYDEIINGLRARNITGKYEMFKNYARSTLKGTDGINTGSELDGRCRLSWYKKLYNDPIQSVIEVEEYSRELHQGLSGSHRGLAELMPGIRKRMDVDERTDGGIKFPECKTPQEALAAVKGSLMTAASAHARAMSGFTQAEIKELSDNLVQTFAGKGCVNGHTVPARSVGRKHADIMDKMDRAAMYDAAEALIPLSNPALLALLDKLPASVGQSVMINGTKVQRLSTAAGDIIIGGKENNVYDLDSPVMRDVICVIDLDGNDTYREGTCSLDRPVFAVIDLHGNDTYTGSKPGIQGGSVLGVSILIDAEGDDTYSAVDLAQGSSMGGAGILIDLAGNDKYKALRRVQGHALFGLGMLIDKKGTDNYHAALWAQGFGAPHGFGVLEDAEGNDHYYCGGLYLDSYPEHPGYDGWGQGVGAGIRQVANGGIGVIIDGSGDDVYEVDYFGQGGGYWLGVGFARDFGGNDIRHGTTKTAYDGSKRQQQEWTRFANGFGCHYSLGYLFDDEGNDMYGGRIMGTGMAWDLSIGYLCDFNGSDKFTATGGMTQGVGAEGSIGILFSYGGNDEFQGRNQAYASNGITYHSPSNCGGNFSFVINYGGIDTYGSGAKNNAYVQRGAQGGFLIDRPTEAEAAGNSVALKAMIEKRNQEIADYDADVAQKKEEAAARGRRYVPRTRRPQPITEAEQQQIGAVPSFNSAEAMKTSGTEASVK